MEIHVCRPRVGVANPLFSLWRMLWRPTAPASRTKSRRTAEESRTTQSVERWLVQCERTGIESHRGHCIFRRQDMLYCYRNNTHILNGFTHPLVAAQCSCWKLTICPVSKSSTVNFSDHEQLLLAIWCTCKVWYEFADVLLHSQSLTNEWPLNFPPRNISSVPRLPQSVNGTM